MAGGQPWPNGRFWRFCDCDDRSDVLHCPRV